MNALTNWISQMIILIFIMMITTMLLPDRKMKKYAQFSLALIFMYFFIQPIRQLFNVNVTRESTQMIESIVGEIPSEDLTESVEIKKNEIEVSSDAYVIEELATQLKHEMKEEFSQNFDYRLEEVVILTEYDRKIDYNQMIYRFKISKNKHHISEIQPIIINTSDKTQGNESMTKETDHTLLLWFSEKLEVDLGQVQIVWEEE